MRVTIATAIEATWAQVLHIYSGQDDVCFGHISSGRDLPVPGIIETGYRPIAADATAGGISPHSFIDSCCIILLSPMSVYAIDNYTE